MKKLIAGITLALMSLVILPSMAQAHTGDLPVTAVCNVETGNYDLTVTLKTSNTNLTGETKWRIGTANFEGTPNSFNNMDRGPVTTQGSQSIVLGTFSLPGTTTGYGPWVYAFTKWSDNFSKGSDGQLTEKLKGDCVKPIPSQPKDKVTYTDWTDETWGCGDTTTTQNREKSVITYIWDKTAWSWVAQAAVVTSQTQTRDLTADEIKNWQTADPDGACFNRPESPEPTTVTDSRDLEPVCVVPANGMANIEHQQRAGSVAKVWDETIQAYIDGETTWGDWVTINTELVGSQDCAPVLPPIEPNPWHDKPVPPTKDIQKTVEPETLAMTGGDNSNLIWWVILASGGVATGVIILGRRVLKGKSSERL